MFLCILVLCSFCFIGIGIFALRRKEPMWFWAGDEDVKHEIITNVKEFNRKNAIMWMCYGALFLIPVILDLCFAFPEWILGVFIVFVSIFGAIAMMIYWEHLHDVYTKH